MALSRQSIEVLLDLVEIKLNAIMVQDREDARELSKLNNCRQELVNMSPSMRSKTSIDGEVMSTT